MKKFILSLTLIILLLSNNTIGESINVKNFKQKFVITDMIIEESTILYKDENYIKLRDFSLLLSHLNRSFSIKYDNKDRSIIIDTTSPYVSDIQKVNKSFEINTANISSDSLIVNGEKKDLNALLINGYNYFRLRDLAALFSIDVDYNHTNKLVSLLTSKEDIMEDNLSLNYKILKDKKQWHQEGYDYYIDKDKNILVINFAKKFNSGGYSVDIDSISYDGKNIIVQPKYNSPSPNEAVTLAITYPSCKLEVDIKNIDKDFSVIVKGIDNSNYNYK